MRWAVTIERHTHGIVMRGQDGGGVPIDVVIHGPAIAASVLDADVEDLVADARVSGHLGVPIAIATREGSEEWRRELGIEP